MGVFTDCLRTRECFLIFKLHYLLCVYVPRCVLETNLWDSVLSLYQVGTRNGTKVVRLGDKCLNQMVYLVNPEKLDYQIVK